MSTRELIIIGGGPAGCSAAVYAARSRIDTLLITEDFGGQLLLTDSVENYLGFPHETGQGISERYEQHVKDYDIDTKTGRVEQVEQDGNIFTIRLDSGDTIDAETVIIATGTKARKLDVPGEEKFRNQGISYCSVCDGPLYADETVAVIGGGYTGTEGALFMSDIAEKVYLVNYADELSGEPITLEKIPDQDNIEVINSADTQKFKGDQTLEQLIYKDRETGEQKSLDVTGAFIEIGRDPNADFIDFVDKDEDGHIKTDEHARTSVRGVFAAGDVSDIAEEQAILAAGEGCAAALQAGRYLKETSQ